MFEAVFRAKNILSAAWSTFWYAIPDNNTHNVTLFDLTVAMKRSFGTRSSSRLAARSSSADRIPVKFATKTAKTTNQKNPYHQSSSATASLKMDSDSSSDSDEKYQALLRQSDERSERVKRHLASSRQGQLIRSSPPPELPELVEDPLSDDDDNLDAPPSRKRKKAPAGLRDPIR